MYTNKYYLKLIFTQPLITFFPRDKFIKLYREQKLKKINKDKDTLSWLEMAPIY